MKLLVPFDQRAREVSPPTYHDPMQPLPELERARTYIDENLELPLSLAAIAQRAHLSRYHFVRLFHGVFHETPHQYLVRKRLEKAKELLANSSLSITEICLAVGFESLGSFSTRFHKTVGWSPSIYRARVLAQRRNPYQFIPGCFCTMYGLPSASQVRNFQEE